MIETIRKAWKVPELRKKLLYVAFILVIFRLGNNIPVPFINTTALQAYFNAASTSILGLMNVMSGGSFGTATMLALSIQPYINASIIIQLLTVAIPPLERLQRDGGEAGKRKLEAITRYSTLALGLLQGFGYYMLHRGPTGSFPIPLFGRQSSSLPPSRLVPYLLCGWANRSPAWASAMGFPFCCLPVSSPACPVRSSIRTKAPRTGRPARKAAARTSCSIRL